MKKDQNLPKKTFIVKIVQENHFQITPIHHNKDIHQNSHKTDTFDHIAERVNVEITIQDQIPANLNFRLIPVPIQILEIKIIQIIDLETLHTIDIETIPTIGIEFIQTIETLDIKIFDRAIILTTD